MGRAAAAHDRAGSERRRLAADARLPADDPEHLALAGLEGIQNDNRGNVEVVGGGWGAILKLVQSPSSNDGQISIVYNGDIAHTALDNVAFFGRDEIGFVEDAGDTLHTQRGKLEDGP